MLKSFKNIEPLKSEQVSPLYDLVYKNDNNCIVFYSEAIFCFEGSKKECLDYIKSQRPKNNPKTLTLF